MTAKGRAEIHKGSLYFSSSKYDSIAKHKQIQDTHSAKVKYASFTLKKTNFVKPSPETTSKGTKACHIVGTNSD